MSTLAEFDTETSTIKLVQHEDRFTVEEGDQVWLETGSRSHAETNFKEWARMHWTEIEVLPPFTALEMLVLLQMMMGVRKGSDDAPS